MLYHHSPEVLAGFHAQQPEKDLPELLHIGEHWSSHVISWHTHTTWEFYIQVTGQCRWNYEQHLYTLTPGNFLAVAPHVPHSMHEQPARTHHYLYAAIDLQSILQRFPELACYWSERHVFFLSHGECLIAPFRQLIREVTTNTFYRLPGIRTALDYLVIEASRLVVQDNEQTLTETSRLPIHSAVIRAKNLIDYQPGIHWQLNHLARMVDISPQHLVECFTRDIGISPHQYLLQVRVARAKELLSQSDLAITDLALELGFSSSQHFSSTFKRFTGMTAQHYRNTSNSR